MEGDIRHDLDQYMVPHDELEYAEYCFQVPVDFNKDKETKDNLDRHVLLFISALLNTCGGIVTLKNKTAIEAGDLDKWKKYIHNKLETCVTTYTQSYNLKMHWDRLKNDKLYIYVKNQISLATLNYNMFGRKDTENKVITDSSVVSQIVANGPGDTEPVNHEWNETYIHGQPVDITEDQHTELKYWNTKKFKDLVSKLREERTVRCMLALSTQKGGGNLVLGIEEDKTKKTNIAKGILLAVEDDNKLKEKLQHILENPTNKGSCVWGNEGTVPQIGQHYNVYFTPVQGTPDQTRRIVVRIQMLYCPGGVFSTRPESYDVDPEGHIRRLHMDTWKCRLLRNTQIMTSGKERRPQAGKQKFSRRQKVQYNVSHDVNVQPPPDHSIKVNEALADQLYISLTKHRKEWWKDITCRQRESDYAFLMDPCSMFMMNCPPTYTPSRDVIVGNNSNVNKFLAAIEEYFVGTKCFAIALKAWLGCFPTPVHIKKPTGHILDIFIVDEHLRMMFWSLMKCPSNSEGRLEQSTYNTFAGRVIKWMLVDEIRRSFNWLFDNKMTNGITPISVGVKCQTFCCCQPSDNRQENKPCPINNSISAFDECDNFFTTVEEPENMKIVQVCLGRLFLRKETKVKQRLDNDRLVKLTEQQMSKLVESWSQQFNVIEGPPGSGKTILALTVCDTIGLEQCVYVCNNPCFEAHIVYQRQGKVITFIVRNDEDMRKLLDSDILDGKTIIIDDCHRLSCSKGTWMKLFDHVYTSESEIQLFIFQDNTYQNFESCKQTVDKYLHEFIIAQEDESDENIPCNIPKRMTEIHRNTRKVASFMGVHMRDSKQRSVVACVHDIIGHDVEVRKVPNLDSAGQENGLLQFVQSLVDREQVLSNRPDVYEVTDITILCDGDGATDKIVMYRELLARYNAHGADVYPVRGVVVDHLDNYHGLDAKVIIFIGDDLIFDTSTDEEKIFRSLNNPKYNMFVTSRGIYRVVFVTGYVLDHRTADMMKLNNISLTTHSDLYLTGKPAREMWNFKEFWKVSDITFLTLPSDELGILYARGGSLHIKSISGDKQEVTFDYKKQEDIEYVDIHQSSGDVAITFVPDMGLAAVDGPWWWRVYLKRGAQWEKTSDYELKKQPEGICWTPTGQLIIVDKINLTKYEITGLPVWQQNKENTGLILPSRLTVDQEGQIYVIDTWKNCVRVFDSSGVRVRTILPDSVILDVAKAVCVHHTGKWIFVGHDGPNHRRQISACSVDGSGLTPMAYPPNQVESLTIHQEQYLAAGMIDDGIIIYDISKVLESRS